MFESEFLTPTAQSADNYSRLIAETVKLLCDSWPKRPYTGGNPAYLETLVGNDFLPEDGRPSKQIAKALQGIVANSVAVSHPNTAAHLHCPPLLTALAAEVVISALNQSMDSFDQAPIATVIEQKMLRGLCSEIGFPESSGGTFTTGGSQSNHMGLLLAREAFALKRWNWPVQKSGLPAESRRMRIFCSEVSHFTIDKSASQLGLGTDAVIRVAVDEHFRMSADALRESINSAEAEGKFPMAVVATAGTTDFGSVDPLEEIAEIAHSCGAWLHVDAAYGGALLFSDQHRHALRGIAAADSLGMDFHKLFWQPIPCSAFMLREVRHFESIRLHADYLNPKAHEQLGISDLVTTSLLTTRRFDALKLWISLQTLGHKKLSAMIERTIALANHAANIIRSAPRLELMCDPQISTVVFRYVASDAALDCDQQNNAIAQSLFDQGIAVIGRTRVRGKQCLKLTCMNPSISEGQIESLIGVIAEEGRKVENLSKNGDPR